MLFLLEKATPKQLPEILDLFKNTIKKTTIKEYNNAQISAWMASAEQEEKWLDKIENQYFMLAKMNDTIVGFGSLDKNYIDLLYVHKDFLRKGIASLLYQNLKKTSENLGFHQLKTHASITAVPFFESKDFKIIKQQKVYRDGVEIVNFEMIQ